MEFFITCQAIHYDIGGVFFIAIFHNNGVISFLYFIIIGGQFHYDFS